MTTLADVARMRLLSQRLVGPVPTVAEAVGHLTCVQGQDYPGSSTSIALRTRGRSLAEVRAAYDTGEIVRSWPMRGTLFVVPAEDLGWMLSLTADKVLHQTERRRQQLGLDPGSLGRAEEVSRATLAEGGATRSELLAAWEEAGHDTGGGRGYHSIFHLAVRGVLCQGPTTGTEQRFVLTERWIRTPRALEREAAISEWFHRYVVSHGPVPVADFLWWTKLLKRDVAPVLDQARAELQVLDVAGVEHWVDPDVVERYAHARRATAAALLLPGFDELVLGYGDRRAVLTEEQEAQVVPGGNGVFKGAVVRSGRAVGTWKRPSRPGQPVRVDPFAGAAGLPAPVERALPRLSAALPA